MSTQEHPELINGGIPEAETIDEKSCFSCNHYQVCNIRLEFDSLASKHNGQINIIMDINALLGKNCIHFKAIN